MRAKGGFRWAGGLLGYGLLGIVAGGAVVALGVDAGSDSVSEAALDQSEKGQRLREGSVIEDEVGEFHAAGAVGERIRFHPENREVVFTVLENLALERVAQALKESRASQRWSVTGVVTEYRGGNYLLLHHTLLKPKPAEPRKRGLTGQPAH